MRNDQNKCSMISRTLSVKGTVAAVLLLGGVTLSLGQSYYFENFESLELGPNVNEALDAEQVWVKQGPDGYVNDDSGVPGVGDDATDGVTEWAGWSFADRVWWTNTAGGQRREQFELGVGTVMIADPDEWDDLAHAPSAENGWFETYITTSSFALSGAAQNSLYVAFNSSWRPEYDGNYRQSGLVEVIYDDQSPVNIFTWLSSVEDPLISTLPNAVFKDDDSTNELLWYPLNNPAGAQAAQLKFGMFQAGNDWWWAVDNISVGRPPLVTAIEVSPITFSIFFTEIEGIGFDTNQPVTLVFDGETISTPMVTVESNEFDTGDFSQILTQTKVSHSVAPDFLTPGSVYPVTVTFFNTLGEEVTANLNMAVPNFPALTPDDAVIGVDTSSPGFTAEVRQVQAHNNDLGIIRDALNGAITNLATQDSFVTDGTLNYEPTGVSTGFFLNDKTIPGINAATPEQFAVEFTGYFELARGAYRLGVVAEQSNARLTYGKTSKSPLAPVLGSGTSAVTGTEPFPFYIDLVVEEDGFYPISLLWYESTGISSLEFFTQDFLTGERIEVNDANNPNSIKVFQSGPQFSYIRKVSPANGSQARPDTTVDVEVVGGTDGFDMASLALAVDGTPTAASAQDLGEGIYSITFSNDGLYPSESSHTAMVSFETTGGSQSLEWTFSTQTYATLPAGLATDATPSAPGMLWRTHILDRSRGTSIVEAEAQLAGDEASIHETFGENADGFFEIDFVNFNQDTGDAGRMPSDLAIPGVGGVNDNIAGLALTYVELPQAGIYEMVVNSDDGFEVTTGIWSDSVADQKFLSLGKFDGGRGSADSVMLFEVTQPGVYFMRLLWFEGSGGANVEWFTVNADGSRALLNGTESGALKTYRVRGAAEPDLGSVGVDPTVAIAKNADGSISISFEGILYSSDTVNGVFEPVSGATSPYTPDTTTNPIQYYRAVKE